MAGPERTLQQHHRDSASEQAAGVLLIRCLVFSFLLLRLARTFADPDLWGHVRFGGDIIGHGLPTSDPYSFASDIPWVNHEWLAEVVMYLGWTTGANLGLIALKMALIAAALLAVAAVLRHDRVFAPTWDFLLFTAIVGMWARVFVLRPQTFSILMFAALLWVIRSAERGLATRLWLLPLLFAAWVNLHGGWIVGVGVLALWTTSAVVGLEHREISKPLLVIVAALAILATLVNPYGWHMWGFLGSTVRFDRPNISDWRPLVDTEGSVIVPWAISAALAFVACWRGGRRIPVSHLLIVLALGLATIRVNRLDVFFTLSIVMLLGRMIDSRRDAALLPPAPLWTFRVKSIAAALALAAMVTAWGARADLKCVRLDGPWMPERESGAFIAQNRLDGRLLAWFDWGQYAIWHFAPRLRVSLDGRRETVYSDAYVAEHLRLYFEPSSSIGLLHRLAPDYAWLPTSLPLVGALEREGWTRLYSGPVSVVLAARTTNAKPVGAMESPACFPGP